jgi:cytoskeletal protein CcmA (bactofilin family)
MAVKRKEEIYSTDINVQDVHTILGPESTFEGKLVFDGTVRIDGKFKGEVRTDNALVIGESARVEAQLFVGSIVVNGEIIGDITAKHSVEIHAPARVRGNIETPQLMIAKGVTFEGSCKMDQARAEKGGAKVTLLSGDKDKDPTKS